VAVGAGDDAVGVGHRALRLEHDVAVGTAELVDRHDAIIAPDACASSPTDFLARTSHVWCAAADDGAATPRDAMPERNEIRSPWMASG
jgi:hypothetical protein